MTERDSAADFFLRRNRLVRQQPGNLQELDADDKNSALDTMIDWFNEQFEDPANDTPWDGEDKSYVYIFGGPFEARDVIWENFDELFPEEWINEAVAEIEKNGIFEWAPKSTGDYYEHQDDEEESEQDAAALRQAAIDQIRSQLDELERQMANIPVSPLAIGHNMPPEEIGLPPYNDEIKKELKLQIELARSEIDSEIPNPEAMSISANYFRKIAQSVLDWTGRKLDLAIDETIKSGIKAATWTSFAAAMFGVADKISTFLAILF